MVLAIDWLNPPAVGAFASWFIGYFVQVKQYWHQHLQNNLLLDLLSRIFIATRDLCSVISVEGKDTLWLNHLRG
ncbi:hypothetical protein DP779_25265 [Salmonella enterica subsp. enterica serovar Bovismorbificans]|nr:hypothetical protein [Salmonella enterica subsp. enterica serovar Bovismorbificans]